MIIILTIIATMLVYLYYSRSTNVKQEPGRSQFKKKTSQNRTRTPSLLDDQLLPELKGGDAEDESSTVYLDIKQGNRQLGRGDYSKQIGRSRVTSRPFSKL